MEVGQTGAGVGVCGNEVTRVCVSRAYCRWRGEKSGINALLGTICDVSARICEVCVFVCKRVCEVLCVCVSVLGCVVLCLLLCVRS